MCERGREKEREDKEKKRQAKTGDLSLVNINNSYVFKSKKCHGCLNWSVLAVIARFVWLSSLI